jgi:hypothetical protein
MALGDHLGADKDVDGAPSEIPEQADERLSGLDGVPIHPTHPGLRKKTLYFPLYPLGSEAERPEHGSLTPRAGGGSRHSQVAEVTAEAVRRPMPGKAQGAVLASRHMAAATAKKETGIPSPVDEKEGLPARRQSVRQGVA